MSEAFGTVYVPRTGEIFKVESVSSNGWSYGYVGDYILEERHSWRKGEPRVTVYTFYPAKNE